MAKKKGKKVGVVIAVLTVLVFVAGSLFLARIFIKQSASPEITYQVHSETYEHIIEIAGTVSAAEEQTLQAKSVGTVIGIYVKKGDKVKKGDLIIQLDAQEQEYNLARLDYDMTSTRIAGSKKELELQEKQRLSLLQKIDDRKVVATFDGIIADLDVAVGDSMEAKDSVGTLVNVDYLIAEVEIPETEVASLKVGQKVIFSFPAYKGDVEGYVVGWPAIGEVTSRGATVVKTKIRIDDYPDTILPNYSFTGKIQIDAPETFFVVESYAIGKDGDASFVETAATGERIPVRVNPYGFEYVKIVDGAVKEGDVLKAQSNPKISGMKINSKGGRRQENGGGGPGMRRSPR